jgi:CRP-like cAMP-binding protein
MSFSKLKDLALQLVPELTEKELNAMEKKTSFRVLKKGENLLNAGEVAKEVAFICKGILRNYVVVENSVNEATNNFAFENMVCSSCTSLFNGTPSLESIQAIENCELLIMQLDDLEFLYNKYHRCERLGRLFLEQLLVEQDFRLRWFIEKNAQERYNSFLEHFAECHHRIPKYLIASYLGITPESLSRLRQSQKKTLPTKEI